MFDYFETTFLTVPVGRPDWIGERTQRRPSSPVEGCWGGGGSGKIHPRRVKRDKKFIKHCKGAVDKGEPVW